MFSVFDNGDVPLKMNKSLINQEPYQELTHLVSERYCLELFRMGYYGALFLLVTTYLKVVFADFSVVDALASRYGVVVKIDGDFCGTMIQF